MQKPTSRTVAITANGRINLPADLRKALGLKGAGRVILTTSQDGLLLTTVESAVKKVQALASSYKPSNRSAASGVNMAQSSIEPHTDNEEGVEGDA